MQTLKIEENTFDTLNESLDHMTSIGGGYVEWYDENNNIKVVYAQSDFEEMIDLD